MRKKPKKKRIQEPINYLIKGKPPLSEKQIKKTKKNKRMQKPIKFPKVDVYTPKKFKKRIAKKKAKMLEKKKTIQETIVYSTKGKQALNPINVTDVILDNSKELIKSTTPDYLQGKYNKLLEIIYTRQDAAENKWNYFWTAKKDQDRYVLRNILNTAIEREKGDEAAVAKRIENSAEDIIALADRIVHDSGGKGGEQLQADYQTFINILLGRSMSASEARFVQENLEQIQAQTLDKYLEDDLSRANPLTGTGVKKQLEFEPERYGKRYD